MPEKICKTVCQHNSRPVSPEAMAKLLEVAEDYRAVKAYVYQRYSGIRSLSKLYPGFTVQNEMGKSGLKEALGIPSVYFYLAVFDALGDIKARWTLAKAKIRELTGQNLNFSEEEKHYLRFLLKTDRAFAGVLAGQPPMEWKLPKEMLNRYYGLAEAASISPGIGRLNRYLCRQVRKHYARPEAGAADGFSLSKSTCRYGDHGIYISTKENRKRVFIPLTDGNSYTGQSYIKLYPEEGKIEIRAPVRVKVRVHPDYKNRTGISLGAEEMLVTERGHIYGGDIGKYRDELAVYFEGHEKTLKAGKKRPAGIRRVKEHYKSYVNRELNRFLKEEMPEAVYLPRLPKSGKKGFGETGTDTELYGTRYARDRLLQKCREHSVNVVMVYAENISRECGVCGASGYMEGETFICPSCGCRVGAMRNMASNAKRRGERKTGHKEECPDKQR